MKRTHPLVLASCSLAFLLPCMNQRASAGVFELDMNSLPTAQGWSYRDWYNMVPESSVFSIQDKVLTMNTIGTPMNIGVTESPAPVYVRTGLPDLDKPFSVELTAKVAGQQTFANPNNHFGFTVAAWLGGGAGLAAAGIDQQYVQDVHVSATTVPWDNTVFHTYRMDVTPAVGYQVYVDGAIAFSSPMRNEGPPPAGESIIYFGDGTGGENTLVEITRVTITTVPEPASTALVIGVGALAWAAVRRRQSS